jgi:hypothetical protein
MGNLYPIRSTDPSLLPLVGDPCLVDANANKIANVLRGTTPDMQLLGER